MKKTIKWDIADIEELISKWEKNLEIISSLKGNINTIEHLLHRNLLEAASTELERSISDIEFDGIMNLEEKLEDFVDKLKSNEVVIEETLDEIETTMKKGGN